MAKPAATPPQVTQQTEDTSFSWRDLLLTTPQEVHPLFIAAKAVLLVALTVWGCRFIFSSIEAPVVVCEPPSLTLPEMEAGDVFNGEFTLTNHSLVRADNLNLNLPADDAYYHYELLVDIPDNLGAKERITVPYRLTCLQSPDTEETASGGGSSCYRNCITTTYSGVSNYGCPFSGSTVHCLFRTCSSSGGGPGGVYIPPTGSGSGGGGSGGYTPPPSPIGSGSAPCTPAPSGGNTDCCPNGGCGKDTDQSCQKTSSWANIFHRSYTDAATDLSVKVPGGSIDIERAYYSYTSLYYMDSWHWRHHRSLSFAGPGDFGLVNSVRAIIREGISYKPPTDEDYYMPDAGNPVEFRSELDKTADKITYLGDNIWRWEDKNGNWENYYWNGYRTSPNGMHVSGCTLVSYGNRQNTIAKLLYDQNVLTGISDRNDRQVIWYTYEDLGGGSQLMRIRDIDNRQIEYEIRVGAYSSCTPPTRAPIYIDRFQDTQGHETAYTYDQIPKFKWSDANHGGYAAKTSGSRGGSRGRGGGGHHGGSRRISCDPPFRYGLTHEVDAAGREKTITYNSNGAVSSVLDSDGNGYFFEYSYEEEERIYYIMMRDTNGKVQEFWINADEEATRVDTNGRTTQSIDKNGLKYTLIDEDGNRTVKTYDQWDDLERVEYPDSGIATYEYDLTLHKVTQKTDENNVVTTYTYDDAGRLTRRVEAKDTSIERVTEFEYDTEGNLTFIRRPADSTTAEAVTAMTYDANGNMETLTDAEDHVTTFTYDVMGNVLTKTDARDKTWTYTYDPSGRLKTVTDPLDHVTEYFYDEVGNKIREVDPAGKETTYEYDVRDNLKKRINPALEETLMESTFDGRITKQTDAEKRTQNYQYDADGRLAKTIDGNANEIDMQYDGDNGGCPSCGGASAGQPSRIEFPTFTREIKYDGRGRKYAQRDLLDDGSEQTTRYAYDLSGNLTGTTDAEGRVTTYEYDALNRLAKVIDADQQETVYTYDSRDNLIALTDAEDQTTQFEYDRNNRLVKEIRPMGEETTYDYDGAGNLIEKIDAKNQRSEYIYDDAGRLEAIRYYAAGDHTTAVKSVTFTYDDAGNLTGYDDGTTSAIYTYDDAYRKATETVNYPGFSKTNTYTYYKNGLKETFTGPDDIPTGYLYDANNQLTGIQIPDVGMFTVNQYRWNRPAVETLPGGTQREYDYDSLMRVEHITALDPGGNEQLNYAYAYDQVDNITAKATEHGDYAYEYDNLYRLTRAELPDPSLEAFMYDAVGNRLESIDTSGSWEYNANNELEGYADTTFQYDANGNMIEKSVGGVTTRFFYNLEDRLERVEDGAGTIIAEYYYDPFGRRLWKDVGGSRTCFVYSDEGLLGEYDGAGNEIKSYGWKPGSTWSTDPLFMKQAGQYYWYHNDHLGTPQMMTNSSGAVVWKAKYTSFGKASVDPSSTVVNPLRFPGQYEDNETGLFYNLFRYYDNSLASYLRIDPLRVSQVIIFRNHIKSKIFELPIRPVDNKEIAILDACILLLDNLISNPEQINFYKYASNSPSSFFDPHGLSYLNYNSSTNILRVYNKKGKLIGAFAAGNRGSNPWPNGTYNYWAHNPHLDDGGPNTSWGSYGNFMFTVDGRQYMGVHSGRANQGGPCYGTSGCIRTTDRGMEFISDIHQIDPLTHIIVEGDDPGSRPCD